jgi:hypothetical protein
VRAMELPENTHWIITYNDDDGTYNLEAPTEEFHPEHFMEGLERPFTPDKIMSLVKRKSLQEVINFLQFLEDFENGKV